MTPYIFTPQILQAATVGTWHNLVNFNSTRIITDTRKLQEGDVFLALVGNNFDGHHFVQTAKECGAVAVICQRQVNTELPQLIVPDTRLALGNLARYRRQAHPNLTVVALTGSSGKTTAKEMLGSILSQVGTTLITKGNLNNDLGVPMTMLELSDDHQFAVFELGANHAGEIAYMADIVQPDVACVLNVGTAHLGEFGGQEGIAQAKAEIFSTLKQDGTAVIPLDDEYSDFLYQQAGQYTKKILTFGEKRTMPIFDIGATWEFYWKNSCNLAPQAAFDDIVEKLDNDGYEGITVELVGDVFADNITLLDTGCQFSIRLNEEKDDDWYDDEHEDEYNDEQFVNVTMSFVGKHNVSNALAASAIATALGVDLPTIAKGLAAATPAQGRLTHLPLTIDGISHLLIDDTYNANPTSVLACADVLAAKTGQKILVLGDIAELGEQSEFEHKQLGQRLVQDRQDDEQFHYLITVGELMAHCHRGAADMVDEMGLPMTARHFEDKSAAINFLKSLLSVPSTILFKGSRSQKMETMIDDLQAIDV